MLRLLKRALRHSRPEVESFQDQVKQYNLAERPFSEALLLRATTYQDEAHQSLRKAVGSVKPFEKPNSLEALAASCAASIAYQVTVDAAVTIGRDVVFLPSMPVPDDAPFVLAFSLLVLAGMHGPLSGEGLDPDFREMAVQNTSMFFVAHTSEQVTSNCVAGIEAFQATVKAAGDHKVVAQWHDNLMGIVSLYIRHWTTTSAKLKNEDFGPAFGQLLSSLLRVRPCPA